MAWINGNFKEDEQDNSKGYLSIEWEEVEGEGSVFPFRRHLDSKTAGAKNKFKIAANKKKNAFLAKKAKQDTISTTLTTFMNS